MLKTVHNQLNFNPRIRKKSSAPTTTVPAAELCHGPCPSKNTHSPFWSPKRAGPCMGVSSTPLLHPQPSVDVHVCVVGLGRGVTLTHKLTSSNFKLNTCGSYHDDRAFPSLILLTETRRGRGGGGRKESEAGAKAKKEEMERETGVCWWGRGGGQQAGRKRELLLLHLCVLHE